MKAVILYFILLSSTLTIFSNLFRVNAISDNPRNNELDIKIVFIGFDQGVIDKAYQDWNNLPYKFQSILIPGVSNDVVFNFKYTYTVADEELLDRFVSYLDSIAYTETRYNVLWNLSYRLLHSGYAVNYTTFEISTINTFYDAEKASEWLNDNIDLVGGMPQNGYTLFIINLYGLVPSFTPEQFQKAIRGEVVEATPHYYNKTYVDVDLGLRTNRRWMTSWGGRDRSYFIDVSAGPSMVDQQLPLQLALSVINIPRDTDYGRKWINQYLSDYVYGAVQNLFAPDFIYPINLSEKYEVDILVIDNRTEGTEPMIEDTINRDEIESQLQDLLPFAKIEVKVEFSRLGDHPELKQLVLSSTVVSREESNFPPPSPYPPNMVDLRPIYEWLSESGGNHLKDLFTLARDDKEWSIPVIVFAFQRDFNLGSTFKEWLAEKGSHMDIWGIALYDVALVSHSEYDLKMGDYLISGPEQPGTGYGFTQTVIHEVGHMIGLNHPFIYDPTQNYVDSVMSYYPYSNSFSRFDKDALWRGFVDDLIIRTQKDVEKASSNPLLLGAVVSATKRLSEAEKRYERMEYLEALNRVKEASSMLSTISVISLEIPPLIIISFVVVLTCATGFVLGYYYSRKHSMGRA